MAVRELASGIDGLYLSAHAPCPEWLVERLVAARGEAEAAQAPVPFRFGNQDFELQPHSWRRYRYLLTFAGGRIGISPKASIPPYRFQPYAEYLHGHGPLAVAGWFEELLTRHLMFVEISVSRLDLYADFEGFAFTKDDLDRFVTPARSKTHFEEDGCWTGFNIGKRKTGTVCARIYDKTAELRVHRAGYWSEIWGRPIEGAQVTRFEVELASSALRQFGRREPGETIASAGAMWLSLTSNWLTLRAPSNDATRSRWPLDEAWLAVQRASLAEGAVPIERLRAASVRADLRWHGPRLVSSLATVAALIGTEDLSSTLVELPRLVRGVEVESGRQFTERVAEKAKRG